MAIDLAALRNHVIILLEPEDTLIAVGYLESIRLFFQQQTFGTPVGHRRRSS